MNKVRIAPALAAALVANSMLPGVASAQSTTTTFTYDALGRLVTTSSAGGPTGGESTTTASDPAGNRTNQTVSGVAVAVPTLPVAGTSANKGSPLVFTVSRGDNVGPAITVTYATREPVLRPVLFLQGVSGEIAS